MRKAFTLIEVMIAVALLAIMISGEVRVFDSLKRTRRQTEYAAASRQAEGLLKQLRQLPFEQLPPQFVRVDRSGWIQLGRPDIDPASVRVIRLEGRPEAIPVLEAHPVQGRLRIEAALAGQRLLVDYAFWGSERNEVHRVPADGWVHLERGPLLSVDRVDLAEGERLQPIRDWTADSGALRLGPAVRGRVVVVDYRGENSSCRVQGRFLDDQLRPQQVPSPIKLLEVRSRYAGTEQFCVSMVRMAQR